MKKKILILVFLFFSFLSLLCQQKNVVNYTLFILSLKFECDNENYIYYYEKVSDIIAHFFYSNFLRIEYSLSENEKYNISDTIETAGEYAKKLESHFILYGSLKINNNTLFLNLKFYDCLKEIVIENLLIKLNILEEPFPMLKNSIENFANKVKEKVSYYDKDLVSLIENASLPNFKKKIVNDILKRNENSYWYYLVNVGDIKKIILIPFLKSSVIFICEDDENFIVESEDIKLTEKEKVKIVELGNAIGLEKKFIITMSNGKKIEYEYKQNAYNEVKIKYIGTTTSKNRYSFFIDNGITGTTAGIFGYTLKMGLGLPFKSDFNNTFYFNFFYGIKLLNYSSINNEIKLEKPNYKFYIGYGYENLISFKNIRNFKLSVGIETGFELYLLTVFITNKKTYELKKPLYGIPAVSISLPLGFHFLTSKRFNLILSTSPIVRFSTSYIFYEDKIYLYYSDYARGIGMEALRWRVEKHLTIDLLFYDMPVIIVFRIKI